MSRIVDIVSADIICGDDGFFVYWPEQGKETCAYTANCLREIAAELDRRNADWEAQIMKHFEGDVREDEA